MALEVKTTKNSTLPKLLKNYFEPVGKGGWPPISTWIKLSFFIGIHIRQRNQGIFISQTKYIREMLKRFRMEDCKPIITPMQTSCKLSKDDGSKSTNQRKYKLIISSLLYVTTSRPNVMQVVGHVA